MGQIIGREREQKILEKLYRSRKAEFLAIYGRRRIGKTHLIREFFKNKGVYFELMGRKGASTKEQLINFHREFAALFEKEGDYKIPKDWSEAFHRLQKAIEKIPTEQKIILFFDELPWLAGSKSRFLGALDYFWNRHASTFKNVILIICGSAAAWMIKKVIHDRGGLHNRLTEQIRLLPYTLSETGKFLKANGVDLTNRNLTEIYMAMGGVPYYLNQIERGFSPAQSIDRLCFSPQGSLLTEFHKLYTSLFDKAERHVKIVQALSKKWRGLFQNELFEAAGFSKGGRSVDLLNELEESGIVMATPEVGKTKRDLKYRLSDEYSLFYLAWIDPVKPTILHGATEDYWIKIHASQAWAIWSGYAFENLCFKHVSEIKAGLGISGVTTNVGYWKGALHDEGAEIDLVIDRADNCINLCEIKFYSGEYILTEKDEEDLERKKRVFRAKTQTKKSIFITLITPFGAKQNGHYIQSVDNQLTLDCFFKD